MALADLPIRKKLWRAIMLTSGSILFITFFSFSIYEFFTFRQSAMAELSVIGKIIASNSTAALAFNSQTDAYETLTSLQAQPHIVSAALYDAKGALFAYYPASLAESDLPTTSETPGFDFEGSHIIGFEPVKQKGNQVGMLFLKSNLDRMYARLQLYVAIGLLVIGISFFVAYILSRKMQGMITGPVLALANTATIVSERKEYNARAEKFSNDEVGTLTDAFNHMLDVISDQTNEINRFNSELEERIKERTEELELVNHELESFTYSVSHDLRAPLRSVDGYSKIILEDYGNRLDAEGKRVLNVIMTNSQKMRVLIDDLLSFSRISKQNLTKTPLDMQEIIECVVSDMKDEVKETSINICEMPNVKGDKSMLTQVWTNLISNAIKYSAKSEKPYIEIGSYHEETHNVYFVKDNGVGFDMQYYDKLFGVFERLHSHTEFEGTGVGLALVQRIIARHGGEVWAQGKVNSGATFYFSLPVN